MVTTHKRACCNNHRAKQSRSQQPEGRAVQIETSREHTPRANLNNQEADQGRANSQMANKSRSQQQESKAKQIVGTRKQRSEADRSKQKESKKQHRSMGTRKQRAEADRNNQGADQGRSQQPKGSSGQIATTRNPSWQFETTQIKSNRGQKSLAYYAGRLGVLCQPARGRPEGGNTPRQ